MDIKNIEKIKISKNLATQIEKTQADFIKDARKMEFEKQLENFNNNLDIVLKFLKEEFAEQQGWIEIKNKDIYFNEDVGGIFPDMQKFELGNCSTYYSVDENTFKGKFSGYTGELITRDEFKSAFAKKFSIFSDLFKWKIYDYYTVENDAYCLNKDGNNGYKWNGTSRTVSYHIPIVRLKGKSIKKKLTNNESLFLLLDNGLVPVGLNDTQRKSFEFLVNIKNNVGKVIFKDLIYKNKDVLESQFKTGSIKTIDNTTDFSSGLLTKKNKNELGKIVTTYLLDCDKRRADIDSYDEKLLKDNNRGHWDIWESENNTAKNDNISDDKVEITLDSYMVARNPALDVRFDGVIGIDFGTKSTVVVYQENSEHTIPMRIGTGRLSKEVKPEHYENPTVMELIDLPAFLNAYNKSKGRPETLWEQLTTSHEAFNSFLGSNSEQFYSYLSELKQWMGDKNKIIRITDKNKNTKQLQPYLDGNNDFDPIELYAYYIGLYINNMHNGIYIDYLLSYPVTYEKNIRDKMVESFTRGIKKSLPSSLLENEEVMSKFRVSIGASEPVAYALCALEEYGFMDQDEKVYYGVFDFGGGTTDFDFGMLRLSDASERRYDYVIESFGASGDKYLGGENLLELLAFEVFKDNADKLRKDNISFILPSDCKRFVGSETLISDSQEAKLNSTQLMASLRDYWEKREGYQKKYESGVIKVGLFNSSGEHKVNYELDVKPSLLDKVIYERIEQGVRNFFEALIQAFNLPKDTNRVDVVHIFLAGNSSKSDVVKELFNKYITENNTKIMQAMGTEEERNFFTLYPPLGSKEAIALQKEKNIGTNLSDIERPTGKTGVAFGLIKSRQGGKIKLVTERLATEEIKFAYYIGYEQRGKFKHITDREIEYGKWYELIDAEIRDFTIFYTDLAEAVKGNLSTVDVKRKNCQIGVTGKNLFVYYRAVGPKTIEYIVAKNTPETESDYIGKIYRVELS